MMDKETREQFDRLTSIEIEALTKDDKSFLKARRSYLTPAQRMAYKDLDFFDEKSKEAEAAKLKAEEDKKKEADARVEVKPTTSASPKPSRT
jgi:hypothetical protein